jgi:hypothetical protein
MQNCSKWRVDVEKDNKEISGYSAKHRTNPKHLDIDGWEHLLNILAIDRHEAFWDSEPIYTQQQP